MNRRFFVILNFVLLFLALGEASAKPFTLVIDAGHGGRDAGATRDRIKEKDINLKVALSLGALIEQNHPDVKIIYTRKKDVFVELNERANIANRAKADLFISIHVNAVPKSTGVSGTETFVLGLSRSDDNLEVAKRENSVILLEDNYEQKYEGFDPNSIESYIIFEFLQNKFMEQSITFASYIQKEFSRTAKRIDRGVKQAGFLVLRQVSMPSVLIELGFVSNTNERNYLTSKNGQDNLCKSIYGAFLKYKTEHDRKSVVASTSPNTPKNTNPGGSSTETTKTTTTDVVYKIQILTSPQKLSPNSSRLKGYKEADYYIEEGTYKYTYGETNNFSEITKMRQQIAKDFKDAFIITFKDGKRIK